MRAAVIQAGGVLFDTPRAMKKFSDLARDAAAMGASIAVFPEAFIGGYPKGVYFGAPVGSRSSEGRDWFRRYYESAINVPGPETEAMAALAGDLNLDIVVGVIERASITQGAGTLYCTALCFSADGKLLGKRRKLMPTAAERVIWGFGDGSTLDVFEARTGRVGAVICWENYMPALRLSQYAQGVQFYCAPTVDDRENWGATMRTIAMEGRCFVLSSCQYLTRADAPEDFEPVQGNDPTTILINGGSMIISPLGDVLADRVFGEETIVTADCDLHDIVRGKMDFDAVGHYARGDVFSLNVNQNPQKPVMLNANRHDDD